MRRLIASRARISYRPRRISHEKLVSLHCRVRSYSDTARASPGQEPASRGAALLRSRRLIELRGPQASQFLQGLTTASIPAGSPEKSKAIYSAFLNAQGRLLQDVFIYHLSADSKLMTAAHEKWVADDEQRFLVEVDASQIDTLMRWLKKYRLRTKVAIRAIAAEEMGVISAWDDSLATTDAIERAYPTSDDGSASLTDSRAPGFGLRIISREGNLPTPWGEALTVDHKTTEVEQQYTIRRYTFGIPEGQTELPHESALVHDSNVDYMGGVDFRKGCYVGQELVIRTQHTGVVRKRILPCMLYTNGQDAPEKIEYHNTTMESVQPGADIKALAEDSRRGRSKGKWLAGIGNIGLAQCRLEDMVGLGPAGDAVAEWESKQWTVQTSTDPRDKEVLVKAFIPSWWEQRIRRIKMGEPAGTE